MSFTSDGGEWLASGGSHVFDSEEKLVTLWVKSLMEKSSWRQGGVQTCLKRLVDCTVGYKSYGEELLAVEWVPVCLKRVVGYRVGYMSDEGE